jgi:hydroxymethylbilane synthase
MPLVRPPLHTDDATGLLVARADALPEGSVVAERAVVWAAGLETWRKLARRGVWVNGCDESLGETGAQDSRRLFPHVRRWVKLSHTEGFDTPHAESIATYRLERCRSPRDVSRYTHFFWRSGSQFRAYLDAFPGLDRAWHGCGPGNTFEIVRGAIGSQRVRAFLSPAQFHSELAG